MTPGIQNFLSAEQFANLLGITVACARRWLLIRKISHVKLGRLVRIPRSEADRLIREGLVPANVDPVRRLAKRTG
jgi:excisionase family DNA binding protein